MTSLEFIEKEIDTYKQLKEQAILRTPDEDDEIQLHLLQRRINMINERLPILEQIKSELLAWEVVKNKISIEKGSIDYANINIKDWHHHLTKKEFETLEKALEVKE